MTDYSQPVVGVGVMLLKDGKVLLGQRKGSHGAGEYAYPGGKLDHMESFEECARRETREETGLEIANIRFVRLQNFQDHDPRHFVDVALTADWVGGTPQVCEPDKITGWAWYAFDNLPSPLFGATASAIAAYQSGQIYQDA